MGDWPHQANWAARNSSYFERESDGRLKGYDDVPQLVEVTNPRTGSRSQAVRRDLRSLLPLVRQRYWPSSAAVAAIRTRDRDVKTTIDARLQLRVAAALRDGIESGRFARGAAVVLDATSGELLAAASYPWPDERDLARGASAAPDSDGDAALLDRARYGLYPPGSTFKLVVAGAALRMREDTDRFVCLRLPGGRVGNYVRGQSRPVRDDPMDTVPHGEVDLERGLIVSCNAYFAQLALAVGPQAVLDAASLFQINVARTPTAGGAETAAGAGRLRPGRSAGDAAQAGARLGVDRIGRNDRSRPLGTDESHRNRHSRDGSCRRATPSGSRAPCAPWSRPARAAACARIRWPLRERPAPRKSPAPRRTGGSPGSRRTAGRRRIAFAVIVENAGYGGRAAAPIAGAIVSAASELGLIK